MFKGPDVTSLGKPANSPSANSGSVNYQADRSQVDSQSQASGQQLFTIQNSLIDSLSNFPASNNLFVKGGKNEA